MIDVVSKSLPYLADKPTIKRVLEECKGRIDDAVSRLLDEEGSISSTQESSSVEREQDSDDEAYNGPNKKQDRRMSRVTRHKSHNEDHRRMLSKLAQHDGSQESFASSASDASGLSDSQRSMSQGLPDVTSHPVKKEETTSSDSLPKPTIKIKIKPPTPPEDSSQPAGKTKQKQQGPERQTARDKKDMKKQAQKAARKERQQATTKTATTGLALRSKGMTNTPPIESGIRTLFI